MVLLAINAGGVAKLDDNTFWRIAPGDLRRTAGWIGAEVELRQPNPGRNMVYPYRLTNLATGDHVGVVGTQVRF